MTVTAITALCVAAAGVITAVVALVHSLQQAGVLKAHLASQAHASPPDGPSASPPVPP
jgi:hypothetical protein